VPGANDGSLAPGNCLPRRGDARQSTGHIDTRGIAVEKKLGIDIAGEAHLFAQGGVVKVSTSGRKSIAARSAGPECAIGAATDGTGRQDRARSAAAGFAAAPYQRAVLFIQVRANRCRRDRALCVLLGQVHEIAPLIGPISNQEMTGSEREGAAFEPMIEPGDLQRIDVARGSAPKSRPRRAAPKGNATKARSPAATGRTQRLPMLERGERARRCESYQPPTNRSRHRNCRDGYTATDGASNPLPGLLLSQS